MLFRFSLYGFLKNQRYFEPFLILVFLDKGLSFLQIGLLISFRELAVNLLEIPSGAAADVWGRRRAMILSFAAYIASFLVFGLSRSLPLLYGAMFLFAVGEAFRTGTHKAMIFAWLKQQGRADERTRVYGYTRSWSKYGSAVSVVLAAVCVYVADSYVFVFYLTAIPYLASIVNFLGYPRELDGSDGRSATPAAVIAHLREGFRQALGLSGLRRLVFESMGFQGAYEATKNYLQPVIKVAAIAAAARWASTGELSQIQRTTLLIGPVYLVLYLLAGTASRQAHRVVAALGDEDRAARALWWIDALLFTALTAAAYWRLEIGIIAVFIVLDALHNIWRPVHLGRFDTHGTEEQGATILSIESQARRLTTVVAAPLLGYAVDTVQAHDLGGPFWPVGLLGVVVAAACLLLPRAPSAAAGIESHNGPQPPH